MYLFVVFLG